MTNPDGLAYIEPKNPPTDPVIDSLTRKAAALLRSCTSGPRYRGVHRCTGQGCKATSSNSDYFMADGRPTTSLLVHYVARHRDEVSQADMEFLAGLSSEAEPTSSEVQ